MAKYKITPLARFFLFMVIAAPLLFLLATYVTGERKYLDQVIEWVQPDSTEEEAAPLKKKADSLPAEIPPKNTAASDSSQSSRNTKNDTAVKAEEDEGTMSLRDSLNLLKSQLKDCKNN